MGEQIYGRPKNGVRKYTKRGGSQPLSISLCKQLASVSTLRCATIAAAGMLPLAAANAQTPAPAPAPAPAAAPAPAPAAPPPAYGKLVVTGLFDGYYAYTFDHNTHGIGSYSNGGYAGSGPSGVGNLTQFGAGAPYTYRQSAFTLSLAELNLTDLAAPGGFGFKATLGAGDTATVNGAPAGTEESRYNNILQLYGQYAFPGANGGELDFGKFYTPFGYEVTESNANWNYTRSTTYNLLPFYHFGFRLESPSYHGIGINLFLTEALYNDTSEGVDNKGGTPGYIGQLNYTDPNGKFTFVETIGGGTDKDEAISDTNDKSVLSDTDFTWNLDANDGVGLNYTYLNQKVTSYPSTTANGFGVYYRHQLNPKDAIALRYDGYEAKAGAGGPGAAPSADFKPYDITGTFEIKSSAQWLTRFEYRFDGANTDTFLGSGNYFEGDGVVPADVTAKDQSTILASEVFTF